jgi:hypothetical protein
MTTRAGPPGRAAAVLGAALAVLAAARTSRRRREPSGRRSRRSTRRPGPRRAPAPAPAARDFERGRRRWLPEYLGGAAGDRCDVRIGRLCYWDNNDDAPLPPEAPLARRGRAALVAELDAAAADDPADDWVAGQRVRYPPRGGPRGRRPARGGRVRGTPWWCQALAGLAHHVAGDRDAAAAARDRVRALLPDDAARCAWDDVSPWLPPSAERAYRRLPCPGPERSRYEARFWRLAQPFWALPATTSGTSSRRAAPSSGSTPGASTRRASRGAATWPRSACGTACRRRGASAGRRRAAFPNRAWSGTSPRRATTSPQTPGRSTRGRCSPRPRRWPSPVRARGRSGARSPRRATRRPTPASASPPLDHQLARFRRGDTLVVGRRVRRAVDRGRLGRADRAGAPHRRPRARRHGRAAGPPRPGATTRARRAPSWPRRPRPAARGSRRWSSSTPPRPPRATRSRAGRGARPRRRARRAAAPPGRGAPSRRSPADAAVSDLLLVRPGDFGPAPALAAVADSAAGAPVVRAGAPFGLYWEQYAPAPAGHRAHGRDHGHARRAPRPGQRLGALVGARASRSR